MGVDLLIVLGLVLLNGLFAMSEIAIVSSKRARLVQMADAGGAGARHALELSAEPTRFLSSVQVGITSIGILSGAIGEASIAHHVRVQLERVPMLAPFADALSLGIMVVGLTYASLILGELVPKRLAQTHPEAIAAVIARPMKWLARLGRPVVTVLSASTDAVLHLLRVRHDKTPSVTTDEIRVLLELGAEEGTLDQSEHDMVTNVLSLDDRKVASVITPRSDVAFLDVRASMAANRETLRRDLHAMLPLCDGGLDRVVGVVRATTVVGRLLEEGESAIDLKSLAEPALFVPETMTLMTLLEQFKRTRMSVALVVDEFGNVEGLVSLSDVTSAIVGAIPHELGEESPVVRREDGSWLIDGGADLETVKLTLEADDLLESDGPRHFHTLGGLAMRALSRVPKAGDVFRRGSFRFEIVDMDGHRVDRVLVSRVAHPEPPPR
jgi:putative hemolysin